MGYYLKKNNFIGIEFKKSINISSLVVRKNNAKYCDLRIPGYKWIISLKVSSE